MTRSAAVVSLLLLAVSLGSLVAGCGAPGAALRVTPYPGDRYVNGRRLETLARDFERQYGCTEEDTIVVTGIASQIYNVDGCNHTRDYQLVCGASRGYAGYGSGVRCDWQAFEDLSVRAGTDFNCDPATIDIQVSSPQMRLVSGCGYQATYQLDCSRGSCGWALATRIEQAGPQVQQVQGGGSYTY